MCSWRQIAMALSVVLSLLAPTMVCAFPNARMTPEEHSCCRQMKGRCGSMNMPASHNCCHKGIQAGHVEALQPKSASYHPAISFISALASAGVCADTLLVYQSADTSQHSPPTSPPTFISVLRI